MTDLHQFSEKIQAQTEVQIQAAQTQSSQQQQAGHAGDAVVGSVEIAAGVAGGGSDSDKTRADGELNTGEGMEGAGFQPGQETGGWIDELLEGGGEMVSSAAEGAVELAADVIGGIFGSLS